MTVFERLLWGSMAGLAIVLVKVVGPDKEYLRSVFGSFSADVAFYVFISAVTILLGMVSAALSNEADRVKLMIFCASVPGLLSTYTAETREPIKAQAAISGPAENVVRSGFYLPVLATPAYAQPIDEALLCKEDTFLQRFTKTGQAYLSGTKQSDLEQFSVVVASVTTFEEAKRIADTLARSSDDWKAYVGCRRPDNEFFPVLIGQMMDEIGAAELKGSFEKAGALTEPPYLSRYPYWSAIYTPTRNP